MKIGIVPYINALPLCFYLDLPYITATPAELDTLMQKGDLDIALLPLFSFLEHGYVPLAEAGVIQSDGPVQSVMLFHKKNIGSPSEIQSIHLTPESRTSAVLFKILFSRLWGGRFSDLDLDKKDPDALLYIGDKALLFNEPDFKSVDLGQVWTEWTNLPFVYALWVSRRPVTDETVRHLVAAKNKGLANINEIIAHQNDFPKNLLQGYLTKSIRYEMNPRSLRGMKLFEELCLKEGLLKKGYLTQNISD